MRASIAGSVGTLVCIGNSRFIDSYSTSHHAASAMNSKIVLGLSPAIPETIDGNLMVQQKEVRNGRKPSSSNGWYRRLWSKVTTRSDDTASNMLTFDALVMDPDNFVLNDDLEMQDAFILQNLENEAPETLFQKEEYVFPSDDTEKINSPTVAESGSPFARITRKTFEKILTERLDRWSKGLNTNMIVECDPTSNILQFMRGQFHCDATINLDRIVFNNFQVSGGQLQAKNFCLNLFSFLRIPLAASPRYPNQFELHAHNMTLTQEDLWESSCIRNGLRRLMNRILKSKGLSAMDISLQSLNILPTGKLSCVGEATSLFGPPITFELRTGVGISGRGHILTLPGLELAISPALGFFVPVIPELTIDLGHNAQLMDIVVDVENMLIKVSACVTITPEHTLRLKEYIQSTKSYGAHCFVDVGQWLTRIGRFAN